MEAPKKPEVAKKAPAVKEPPKNAIQVKSEPKKLVGKAPPKSVPKDDEVVVVTSKLEDEVLSAAEAKITAVASVTGDDQLGAGSLLESNVQAFSEEDSEQLLVIDDKDTDEQAEREAQEEAER